MSHQQSYLRFQKFLEDRQRSHDRRRDIRQHVLSLTASQVGTGLVSEVLNTRFGANLPNLFPKIRAVDAAGIEKCSAYFMHGTVQESEESSHKGAVKLLSVAPANKPVILMETSFLATTHSWIHSSVEKDPAYACLGYVYDDIAHYFMADYPNRLIRKLNSEETPSEEELTRAERLLTRIVDQRISKYNAQPMRAPAMTEGYARRVMVCDQAFADASTIYGKVGEAEFEQMLQAAIDENPDAEILVKTHPDTSWGNGKRTGYYTHLQSSGRVRVLRDPVNPYMLFDQVDTVYVGTSQMGLEALFAGKKVVTFGAPFYAGWGLTDDRQQIQHRQRERSLVEIFHYFYIWYTIYHLPGQKGPAEIEDVLSYIETNRPYPLPPTKAELAAPPKVSVVVPVYGVEKYLEQCINSIQRQTLREIEIIPINDASPDNSQAIIDRLAAEDGRIRPVVLTKNIQLGMVRNRGIAEARGKYIWFIDSDDWLGNPDMLRQVYEVAEERGLDMARSRKAYEAVFDENDQLLRKRNDYCEDFFQTTVPETNFAESPVILKSRHCWTWLYRTEFLREKNIRFMTPKWEERAFLHQAFVKSRAIGMVATDGPVYRIRQNSISRSTRSEFDYQLMQENFHHTFNSYLEVGAEDRNHPLRGHLNYQLSQFVQQVMTGRVYPYYRDMGEDREAEFLSRLRDEFQRCDFRPDDFVTDIPRLSKDHLLGEAFPLMIAAIRADRVDLLRHAVDLTAVPQKTLYQTLMSEPTSEVIADLQVAVNRFARNERVQISDITPAEGKITKPRVIIHIGATKTGSTYIQHMLEKNRAALLRKGVWFPEVGLFWQPTRPRKQAGHANFTRAAVKKEPALIDHIQRGLELMDGQIHTIVLSSEAFFLHEAAHRLADYFAGHEVEMVVYLRRQDEWANSQYSEFVAGGAVGRVDVPFGEWLEKENVRRRLDYSLLLRKWRDKIGLPNVHVRIFDRSQFVGGDLLSDFADATGLPQLLDLPRPDEKEQNDARLSAAHVELLRQFNMRPFKDRDSYFNFIEEVGTAITDWRRERDLPLPKPWIPSEAEADALMAEYADINKDIAQEYLGRQEGEIFGPRGKIPEPASVHAGEIELIDQIYRRHAGPTPDAVQRKRIKSLEDQVADLSAKLRRATEKKPAQAAKKVSPAAGPKKAGSAPTKPPHKPAAQAESAKPVKAPARKASTPQANGVAVSSGKPGLVAANAIANDTKPKQAKAPSRPRPLQLRRIGGKLGRIGHRLSRALRA